MSTMSQEEIISVSANVFHGSNPLPASVFKNLHQFKGSLLASFSAKELKWKNCPVVLHSVLNQIGTVFSSLGEKESRKKIEFIFWFFWFVTLTSSSSSALLISPLFLPLSLPSIAVVIIPGGKLVWSHLSFCFLTHLFRSCFLRVLSLPESHSLVSFRLAFRSFSLSFILFFPVSLSLLHSLLHFFYSLTSSSQSFQLMPGSKSEEEKNFSLNISFRALSSSLYSFTPPFFLTSSFSFHHQLFLPSCLPFFLIPISTAQSIQKQVRTTIVVTVYKIKDKGDTRKGKEWKKRMKEHLSRWPLRTFSLILLHSKDEKGNNIQVHSSLGQSWSPCLVLLDELKKYSVFNVHLTRHTRRWEKTKPWFKTSNDFRIYCLA